MSSNDRTRHPSAYEYHRRQIADLEAERDNLKQDQRTILIECGKLEYERDRLRERIADWAERLQWADGLSEVVQEMREEAKR